jgi:hypothetical protein
MDERCAICKYWRGLTKKGPVYLCKRHTKRYIWDRENEYLRQKNRGGKWERIWPSQGDLAKAISRLGYKVDQEVMPLWSQSKKGVLMPFDIAIPEIKVLIEYQGEQHDKQVKFFFKRKNTWLAYIGRQTLKRDLAEKNGWKVIEFRPEDKPFTGKRIRDRLDNG